MKLKNSMTVYKVCRKGANGILHSMVASNNVVYTIGQVAYPPLHGHPFLFAFNDYNKARNVARRRPNRVIVKSIGINPACSKKDQNGQRMYARRYPFGTVFCDAILPVEQLK